MCRRRIARRSSKAQRQAEGLPLLADQSIVRRTEKTEARPHGISYALVFRPIDGEPYVRFDNAHAVVRPGGRFSKQPGAYDHRHQTEIDPGRPYAFTTAMQLLDDFWREVKRVMMEKEIPNDL